MRSINIFQLLDILEIVYYYLVMQLNSYQAHHLDVTFAALADPTRRAILERLMNGEATVTELVEPFSLSQPAISKHLRVLEQAGLVSRGRDAQKRPVRIEAQPLAEANAWLEHYRQIWETNYRRLDTLLEELKTTGETPKRKAAKK